jgi:threonine synthase
MYDASKSLAVLSEPPEAIEDPYIPRSPEAAQPPAATLPEETGEDRQIAADPAMPLESRLQAYENIFESEVGDTSLSRARNLERELGLRQLYLKFEGGNPTGTQKDRIAFVQAMDALRRRYETLTLASCGNYGAAMALAASLVGLRCRIYIPEAYQALRSEEILARGAELVRVAGDYEQAVLASRRAAELEELYDANPGGANTVIQLRAYGQIAYEIYDELRDAPAVVAAPVSNGTTLAGIHWGFASLFRRGKTSRLPRMVAGSSSSKNPIVQAALKGLEHCCNLDPEAIRESPVNEPLINWHSGDGEQALQAIRASRGWAADASDRRLLACSRLLRDREGLHVLPASTAGLLALADRGQALPPDRYVVILTGRRS